MLFTSKSDAILDAMLAQDPVSRVAVESLVTIGTLGSIWGWLASFIGAKLRLLPEGKQGR